MTFFCIFSAGYAHIQGISESFMGWMSALSGIFGIAGTLVYPYLYKKTGLKRTGIIGMSTLVASLTFCLISVWTPGSPFDLNSSETSKAVSQNLTMSNLNGTIPGERDSMAAQTNIRYESIALFITGIIVARFGKFYLFLYHLNLEHRKL